MQLTQILQDRIADARLNAFILFKSAKNISSIAILSEWPLAVFPELKPGPKIKVKQASPATANPLDPGPLPKVEELRLDSSNDNPHLASAKCMVDISKAAGFLSHLPNLRNLEIRGGHNTLSAAQVHACHPRLANITTLNLSAVSESTLRDLLLCCNPNNLKHFRVTIPPGADGKLRFGNDLHGEQIVNILTQYGVADTLETLTIDTSHSTLMDFGHGIIRDTFQTISTLKHFTSLRHLSLSADTIYFPSLYPRILLRDTNTGGDEDEGQRLVRLLPYNLESLEITGIHAILRSDMKYLAQASHDNGGQFEQLDSVVLKGDARFATLPTDVEIPYPLPEHENEWYAVENWHEVEAWCKTLGPEVNDDIRREFRKAGVEYEFDMPEFYFGVYSAEWDDEP
jgi:hypothetical protein